MVISIKGLKRLLGHFVSTPNCIHVISFSRWTFSARRTISYMSSKYKHKHGALAWKLTVDVGPSRYYREVPQVKFHKLIPRRNNDKIIMEKGG